LGLTRAQNPGTTTTAKKSRKIKKKGTEPTITKATISSAGRKNASNKQDRKKEVRGDKSNKTTAQDKKENKKKKSSRVNCSGEHVRRFDCGRLPKTGCHGYILNPIIPTSFTDPDIHGIDKFENLKFTNITSIKQRFRNWYHLLLLHI